MPLPLPYNVINGTNANDVLYGYSTGVEIEDEMFGYGGNDRLVGSAGNDTFHGGDGEDTVDYSGSSAVRISLFGGLSSSSDGEGSYDFLFSIEHVTGGNGNDFIIGDELSNYLTGNAGDDKIYGHEGNDLLLGGDGNDRLGGDQPEEVSYTVTSFGSDTIRGGNGNDSVFSDFASPTITASNDVMYGDAGNDTLQAGDGNDWISGGTENDSILAYGGNNTIYGDDGNDTISAHWGWYLQSGNNFVNGGAGNDTIVTGGGADTLIGGTGASVLFGGAGNDLYVVSEAGQTFMRETSGTDTIEIGVSTLAAIKFEGCESNFALGTNIHDLRIKNISDTNNLNNVILYDFLDPFVSGARIETLRDSTGAILTLSTVLGDNGNNAITMTNTTYYAFGGNDSVTGNAFNNLIYGGLGNDTLTGVGGADTLFGNEGNDSLSGSDGADSLEGGDGLDTLIGGTGSDTILAGLGNDSVDGGTDNDFLEGGDGLDTLIGGVGVDTLSGGAGNDSMDGGADNDFFDGGAGYNTLVGGGGNDAYFHNGTGQSYIIDSSGTDTLYITTADLGDMQYSSIVDNNADGIDDDLVIYFTSAALSANDRIKAVIIKDFDINVTNRVEVIVDAQNDQQSGTLATFGTNDDDTITGTSGNELVHGFQGNDLVNGGAGNDTVIGWTGNDTAYGDDGNDSLLGGAGADSIFGGTGNDYISSSSSNDVLNGGDGLDTMLGVDGLDTLTGGAGADVMNGGAGVDVFMYLALTESTGAVSDRLQTFDAMDIINVDALNFTSIAYGTSADSNPLALRYYNTTSRTYVVDDTSGFTFYMDGVWALNASDFVF